MSYRFEKPFVRYRFERGFTLIEILVAVAIFGLIGVASGQLLMRVVQAQQVSEARADRLAQLQRALATFERDVLQAVERPIRDQFGDPQPAMRLTPGGSFEFTRDGWSNPLGLARSDLQRVAWELNAEGYLERQFWVVLDRAQDSAPRAQRILEGVEDLSLQLLDVEGGTWDAWPADDRAAGLTRLPGELPADDADTGPELAAVRLALVVPPFGRIERLLPLSRPTPSMLRPEADVDQGPDVESPVDTEVQEGDAGDG